MNKFIFLALLYLILSCNKDAKYPGKNYPYFITKEVTEIDSSGVTFNATFIHRGSDSIIDLGFVLLERINKYEISAKQNGLDGNNWKFRVSNDLGEGTYKCQSYVKTSQNLILGNIVTFTSLGFKPPIIESISPNEGYDGARVILKGKNFSTIPYFNEVYVNREKVPVISSKEDEIVFKIPNSGNYGIGEVILRLPLAGYSNAVSFNVFGPEIISISKLICSVGDTIVIKGRNFFRDNVPPIITMYNSELEIVRYTDNEIYFILPYAGDLFDFSSTFILKANYKILESREVITIKKRFEAKQLFPFEKKGIYFSFSYNHKGYFYGKDSGELMEYDPKLNQWDTKTRLPDIAFSASAYLADNENFYVVNGGSEINGLTKALWVYNFLNRSWKKLNNVPFTFNKATTFNINNKNYIIVDNGIVWRCDFVNGIFDQLPGKYPVNSFSTNPFKVKDKILFAEAGATIEFDDIHGTWSILAANQLSGDIISVALNKTGYALEYNGVLNKFFPGSNEWRRVSSFGGCYVEGKPDPINEFLVIDDIAYVISTYFNICSPIMYSYKE